MANMFDNICSSSYSPMSHEPSDDISVLLRQILSKSSSSSSSSSLLSKQQQQPHSVGVANVAVNVGAIDYDPSDEYDCESQEGFENLMEEMDGKPNPPRNPSKRMRAAEVHNMSEKRRRSRINEKMKALQKLIPNSNKTDKASMLDEAIEYLKQLQLQVQMLTMRNGINLHSMCTLHGVVQPNHRPFGVNQGNYPINMSANQERLVNPMLGHPIQCVSQNKQSILDFSRTINQEPPFGTQLGSS